MWPISWLVLVMMTEREKERERKKKKEPPKKDLSSGTVVNIWGISGVKIFLEFSHLLRRKEKQRQSSHICRGEKRSRDSQQQVPSLGLDSSYYT